MLAQHFRLLNHGAIHITREFGIMDRLRLLSSVPLAFQSHPTLTCYAYAGIDQAEVYVIPRKLPSQERASLSQQNHQFNPHECYRASVPRKSLHLPIPTSPDATHASLITLD